MSALSIRLLARGIGGSAAQRYVYDAANRMVQVADDSNYTLATYTYGEGKKRLVSDEGGFRTYYSWSGESVIAEYGEVNNSGVVGWNKSYIFLGARLLATLQPNGAGGESTQFHHPDRLGTRLITNASDSNYFEQVSLPYGTALDAESTGATNRRFTSYDRSSATGLDYAVNRHYDSLQGRFTQADPIGAGASSLGDPQSLNMYAYCGGDPINRTDPNGLFWGKLWHNIQSFIKRVVNAAIHAAITAGVTFITSGFNPHVALAAGVADFLKEVGWPSKGFLPNGGRTTPGFNPNAGAVLSSGAGGLNKYIIFNLQGDAGPYGCGTIESGLPQCSVTITATRAKGKGFWEKVGGGVNSALGHIGAVAAGFADSIPIIGRFPRWARRQLGVDDSYERDIENSWDYTVGQVGEVAWEAYLTKGIFNAAGWELKALRYPNAGGGGINIYENGARRFALDWHKIKSVGPRNYLHWHWGATKKAMKIHRGFWTGRPL